MKTKMLVAGMLVCGMNLGCFLAPPPPPPAPVGPDGLQDTNNNGFFEVPPPVGEDVSGRIQMKLVNEIDRTQLTSLFSLDAIPGASFALDAIDINVTFDVTLTFAGGGESMFSQTEKLGPFEIAVEADCPETISTVVTIDAEVSVPLVGPIPLFSQTLDPFVLTQGADFECDKVVRVMTTFDEATGQPALDVSVESIR